MKSSFVWSGFTILHYSLSISTAKFEPQDTTCYKICPQSTHVSGSIWTSRAPRVGVRQKTPPPSTTQGSPQPPAPGLRAETGGQVCLFHLMLFNSTLTRLYHSGEPLTRVSVFTSTTLLIHYSASDRLLSHMSKLWGIIEPELKQQPINDKQKWNWSSMLRQMRESMLRQTLHVHWVIL